jgi:hypothetical protein
MKACSHSSSSRLLLAFLVAFPILSAAQPTSADEAAIIRGVDAAVKARLVAIESYTDTETYQVFRGSDETHPAAAMTVKTTYQQETGKSYQVLSESGSDMLRKYVLDTLLDNERRINEPANRASSWLTSANYRMSLKPGGPQKLDGHECYVMDITPYRKAPNLIEGTIWVDTRDESIVQLQGKASKSVSMFVQAADVMRQYAPIRGFAEATHARATSDSKLLGPTVVTIDYSNYAIKLRNGN